MKNATVLQILVAMMLLAVGVTAQAQQPKKVRIGYLSNVDPTTESARAETIQLASRVTRSKNFFPSSGSSTLTPKIWIFSGTHLSDS